MVVAATKEPPRGRWPKKQNRGERERRERGWSNGEEGGEALRERGRGRQCTETQGNKPTTTAAKGGRRSSSKRKRRNIGHVRGKEFLCPKRRDSNAVVSGNFVCM